MILEVWTFLDLRDFRSSVYVYKWGPCRYLPYNPVVSSPTLPFDSFASVPRLTLYSIMNLCSQGMVHWAPDCGSWGIPGRGTSMRSFINPEGYTEYEFVRRANVMVSRILRSNIGDSVYGYLSC